MILPSASGCLATASVALAVAIPIPRPAPNPVNAAIAAQIAVKLIFVSPFYYYSTASFIYNDVKNTNTYA